MMSIRLALSGLLAMSATVVFAQPRHGGQDASALLQRIIRASKVLRYSGTRTVELRFGPDQQKHIEYVLRDGTRSRVEFPPEGTYRGQILVEADGERRHYMPDRNQIEIQPARGDEMVSKLLKMMRKAGAAPEFGVSNGPRIAGIDTEVIELGRANRPMVKLWIDPNTFLILKREVYGREGKLMVVTEYTKIDYTPRRFRDADFRLRVPGAKEIRPRDRLGDLIAKGGFQNVSLPPKDPFKMESCRIQRIGDTSSLVQVYVNGDARISLFQVRTQLDPRQLRQFVRGELNVHTWSSGGSSFALLGDLPEDKLRDIAQRLTP